MFDLYNVDILLIDTIARLSLTIMQNAKLINYKLCIYANKKSTIPINLEKFLTVIHTLNVFRNGIGFIICPHLSCIVSDNCCVCLRQCTGIIYTSTTANKLGGLKN